MKNKKKYKRLQFDFSDDAVQRLDFIVDKTESTSRAEVVRNALRVYEYLVTKTNEGYSLEFKKEDLTITVAPLPL